MTNDQSPIEHLKGPLARECKELNKFFLNWVTKKRPFITVKVAISADGFVAGLGGEQVHLTTAAQDREVHNLRASHQAIMVGINTVLNDDPSLTVRHVKGYDPLRIILDSKLRIPMNAKILKNKNCLVVTTSAGARSFHGGWNANLSTQTTERRRPPNFWVSPTTRRVSLKKLMSHLGDIGISSVLVEPGPTLYSSLKKEGLIDELIVYRSKKKLGKGLKINL
jgi:diaminohydroxyphosphoribosylaminopyrimidine deaminase/5-amino-6-(5-phosphoribosylamino)uracil reductase